MAGLRKSAWQVGQGFQNRVHRRFWGGKGQAKGRHLRGIHRTGGTWFGETLSTGRLLRISTPGRRGMLLVGGVAGAEPPHKGGPNRPDRPELQLSVVSGQRGRFLWRRLAWKLTAAWLLPGAWERSHPFWDAGSDLAGLPEMRKAARMRAAVYFICCAERPSTYRRELCRSTR